MGLMLLAFLMPITALADTITVGPSDCNYTHIWEALDVASSGDTIEVQSDIYYENVIVDKAVILRGIRGNNTGNGMPRICADGLRSAVKIIADGATVQGFIVSDSGSQRGDAGIEIISNNNTIVNNHVAFNQIGIHLISSFDNNITGNRIYKNRDDGTKLVDSGNNMIAGNYIFNNTKPDYAWWIGEEGGVSLLRSDENLIIGNYASNNEDVGILLENSDENILIRNFVDNNYYKGLYIGSTSANNLLYLNIISNNTGGNAVDYGEENQWDNGTIGNCYGDFDEPREGCRDPEGDGICNFAYEIPGGSNIDRYPLVFDTA